MKVALTAAPFIAVPPADYGRIELFVAHLAQGLQNQGIDHHCWFDEHPCFIRSIQVKLRLEETTTAVRYRSTVYLDGST